MSAGFERVDARRVIGGIAQVVKSGLPRGLWSAAGDL